MKKLSKILASSMALALTFSMTTFAAVSPGTVNKWADDVQSDSYAETEDGTEVTLVISTDQAAADAVDDAVKAANSGEESALITEVKEAAGYEESTVDLVYVVDIDVEGSYTGTVTVSIPVGEAAPEGSVYVLMHEVSAGNWQKVATVYVDGYLVFDVDSFSNFALFLVKDTAEEDNTTTPPAPNPPAPNPPAQNQPAPTQPTAPQTGETAPVAGFVALILLAGAAVCAKKAQFNN